MQRADVSTAAPLARRYLQNNELQGVVPDLSRLKYLRTLKIGNNLLLGRETTECANPDASNVVRLDGADKQSTSMGLYVEIEITAKNEYAERDNRPVFYGAITGKYLYFHSIAGDWNVGSSLGSTAATMYIISTAQHPMGISGTWKESNSGDWIDASEMTVSCPAVDVCTPGSTFAIDFKALFASIKTCDGCSGCMSCAPGTASPGYGASCTQCLAPTFCVEGANEATPCPSGTYGNVDGLETPACSGKCGNGTYCPRGSRLPTTCPAGASCPSEGMAEPKPCAPGFAAPPFATHCDECEEGSNANAKATACVVCAAGFYCPDATRSLPCAPGSVAPSKGAARCAKCTKGRHANAERTACDICAVGDWAAPGSTNCTACVGGRYSDALFVGAANDCKLCDGGKVSSATATGEQTACIACGAGKYSNALLTECVDCKEGRFSAAVGAADESMCNACPPGTRGTGVELGAVSATACVACANGEYQDEAGQTECKLCDENAGSTDNNGSLACNPCPPGSHTDAVTRQCVECEAGEFSAGGSATDCLECAKGEYTSAKSSRTCLKCLPGTKANKADEGATDCAPCADGEYQDEAGQTECKPCDPVAGSIKTSGSLACKPCPAGTYKHSDTGVCTPCDAGCYSAGGEVDKCIPCPVGESSSAKAGVCTQCLPGSRSNRATGGATACDECIEGSYQDEAGQTECKACDAVAGSTKTSGSLACNPCPPGTIVSQNGTCTLCPVGTVSSGGLATKCTKCTTGSSERGSSYCTDCQAGTYLNMFKNPATCTLCPAGTVSKAAALKCTLCKGGTYQSGTDCLPCDAGAFGASAGLSTPTCSGLCPPGAHSSLYATACTPCEIGKHAPYSGSEVCDPCDPSHPTYLTSDAPGATECVCLPGKYNSSKSECLPCSDGMDCSAAGSDVLDNMGLTDGHWRPSDVSDEVLECPIPKACVDGSNSTDGRGCVPGNKGVMCAVCAEGFYRPSFSSPCEACGAQGAAVASFLGILLAMALALAIFVVVNRKAPSGLLRPFINLVQTLTVMLMFDAPFPESLVKMGKALSGLSLGVEVASPQCAGLLSSGHYANFATTVLTLLLVCAGMMVAPLRAKFKNGWSWSETARSREGAHGFRDLFVVVLLLYPTVSGKAMEFFRCQRIDGVAYLMADYAIVCHDAKWWTFLPLVLLVLLAFTLGTPVAIFLVLHRQRATLYEDDGKVKAQPLDTLYAIYQPRAYYYESVQMASSAHARCCLG